MNEAASRYRRLDSEKIVETVRSVHERIERRFPGAGLGKVAAELLRVAEEAVERADWIQKPHLALRCAAGVLSVGMVAVVIAMVVSLHRFQIPDYTTFIQSLEASLGSVVFIGAAILFLTSWETRIKRSRALNAIHELRALAHIVDMHQLSKDPEVYFGHGRRPLAASAREMTPFELNRYLDYCSDSLALISKIAAIYAQGFQDPVLLSAVDDVEELTSGLSQKIWQKITILDNLLRAMPVKVEPSVG